MSTTQKGSKLTESLRRAKGQKNSEETDNATDPTTKTVAKKTSAAPEETTKSKLESEENSVVMNFRRVWPD